MTVLYTSKLQLALPVTGTESGTWGEIVDDSITQLLEDAIAGSATFDVTAGDWTLTTSGSGAPNQARVSLLIVTGSPLVPRSIIAPAATGKSYIVINRTQEVVTLKTATSIGAVSNPQTTAGYVFDGIDFQVTTQPAYFDTNAPTWTDSNFVTTTAGAAGASSFTVAGNATGVFTTGLNISFQNQRTTGQSYVVNTATFSVASTVVTFTPALLVIDAFVVGATIYSVVGGPAIRTVIQELFLTSELTANNNNGLIRLGVASTLTDKVLVQPLITGGSVNNASVGLVTPADGAFNNLTINNAPIADTQAANKAYVDGRTGRNYLGAATVATTINLAAPFMGLIIVDGYQTVANDRVVVKNQIDQTQNGVYTIGTNAPYVWSRATDASTPAQLNSAFVLVTRGNLNAGFGYVQTATVTTVGSSAITWAPISLVFPFPLQTDSGLSWNAANRLAFVAPGAASATGGQPAILQAVPQGDGTTRWTSTFGTSNPVNATDFVNKNYADGLLSGLNAKPNVVAATAEDLMGAWTYNNAAGTLTGPVNYVPVVDGYTAQLNDRLLVKNQGSQAYVSATPVMLGTGYAVGNVVSLVGGDIGLSGGRVATFTVSAVNAGAVTAVTVLDAGFYRTLPANPVSTTGAGTGLTLNGVTNNNQFENGIYQVTQLATASLPSILARTADANTYAELVNAVVTATSGTTQAGLSFATSVPTTGTLGTTPIVFVSFGFAGNTPLAVTRGGTGIGSLPAGYIPFGADSLPFNYAPGLFWSTLNNRLGLNSQTPEALLHVGGTTRIQEAMELATLVSTALTGTYLYNVQTNGAVTYFTVSASGNFSFNFTGGSGVTLNSILPVGRVMTISILTTQGGSAFFNNVAPMVDGTATGVTNRWAGVTAPSFGNANGIDVYTFSIVKTAATPTYTILSSQSQFGG